MNKSSLVLLFFCGLSLINVALAACGAPPSSFCGRPSCKLWYVDPVNGKQSNDGSTNSPWSDLNAVLNDLVSTNKLSSVPWDGVTRRPAVEPYNPTGPIKAGDVIVLRNGHHTAVFLRGAYNTLPITIVADEGHEPKLDCMDFSACSNWKFYCLTIAPKVVGSCGPLASYANHGYHGPAYLGTFANNTLYSYTNLASYAKNASGLESVSADGIVVSGDTCEVSNNYIHHVAKGFMVEGYGHSMLHNTIDYVIADGMRLGSCDNCTVSYNSVSNCMLVNDDHLDGLQVYAGGDNLYNLRITHNKIVSNADPSRPFPEAFQGIVAFDDNTIKCVIENNLVVTEHWHGITLNNGTNCRVVSNTVIDPTLDHNIWITITSGKKNLVQNNIVFTMDVDERASQVNTNWDTTMTTAQMKSWFVNAATFDFRLKTDSPAVGAGNATNAPTDDITGRTRELPYDLGCFDYSENSGTVPLTNNSENPNPTTTGTMTASTTSTAEPSTNDTQDESQSSVARNTYMRELLCFGLVSLLLWN